MKKFYYSIQARTLLALLLLAATFGEKVSAQVTYEEAAQAVAEGRTEVSEAWYQGLNNREKRQLKNLLLAARSAIIDYDADLAEERVVALEKLRLRKEEEVAARDELLGYYEEVQRMLSNTREVTLLDSLVADSATVYGLLERGVGHLGLVTPTSYTTPKGEARWEVAESGDESPRLSIVYQLSDGSYDRAHAQTVAVRGLDPLGQLSHPFLLSDGQTLYFAYDGPGTMGGADLYVTRYNRNDHTLLVPQKLPLPFNSPVDDLFYIVDEANDLIWLGSSRGVVGDSLQLFLIANSSVRPLSEGSDVGSAAKLEIAATDAGHLARVVREREAQPSSLPEAPIYFVMQGKAIRIAEDLPTASARHLFERYLALHDRLTQDENRLTELRQTLREGRQRGGSDRLQTDILALEERVYEQQVALKALRNEIIVACGLE